MLGPRCFALLASLALALPALAQIEGDAEPFAIPIGSRPLELGAGFDSKLGMPRAEPGSCVADAGTEERDGGGPRWSLAVLSRAGGRLVVGIHVSAPVGLESLSAAQLTDAARRLGGSDAAAFRDLCGDGFIAARLRGAQWLAEVEVDPADAGRALAGLITGTWSEPEPFQAALEQLVKSHRVTVRELPDGDRAQAQPLATESVVARAVEFPESVTTSDDAAPYLAIFAPYDDSALSGVELPDAEDLDARDIAEQVFRGARGRTGSRASSRAAEMRAAQVRREPEPASGPESPLRPAPAIPREPAAEIAPARPAPAGPAAAAIHKQAALVFEIPGELPVYATTSAPGGVYAEQERQRSYWVPGVAAASPEVTRAIARAKAETPVRGTTVVVAEVGATTVVMTDAAPVAGVHAAPAGERRAWIAGVAAPDAAQRAAIAAAVAAAD